MTPDAIVVGAGIIGGSIAWTLARHGARVTLIDAGSMGGEASWAGAGMLAPGGEIEERSAWSALAVESLRLYPRFVNALQNESGEAIDFRRCGAIELAKTADESYALERRAARQIALGIPSRPCGQGRFFPEDATVDPRDIMRTLRAACLQRGVSLIENTPVSRITAGPSEARVDQFSGRIAVLAAGAWSSSIPVTIEGKPMLLPTTYPVRGHLLGFHLEPGSLPNILRYGHTYLLQRSSGYLIAGASTEHAGFDRNIDRTIVSEIRRRAEDLFPPLIQAGEPDSWIGFRPGAESPAMERVAGSSLWLAYGHYRNGILLAPATAQRVAEEIMSTLGMGSSSPPGTI